MKTVQRYFFGKYSPISDEALLCLEVLYIVYEDSPRI